MAELDSAGCLPGVEHVGIERREVLAGQLVEPPRAKRQDDVYPDDLLVAAQRRRAHAVRCDVREPALEVVGHRLATAGERDTRMCRPGKVTQLGSHLCACPALDGSSLRAAM
jgi:hypothetical protein